MAPSGGVPTGGSASAGNTAADQAEEKKNDKDMTICKGC